MTTPTERDVVERLQELLSPNRTPHAVAVAIAEITRLRSELEAAREALASVLPPTHGIHGGPLVGLRAIYEDGSDESSARHRGWIAHETIEAARAAYERAARFVDVRSTVDQIGLSEREARAVRINASEIAASIRDLGKGGE